MRSHLIADFYITSKLTFKALFIGCVWLCVCAHTLFSPSPPFLLIFGELLADKERQMCHWEGKEPWKVK